MNKIPVIDLFAGPGGLAEGFSTLNEKGKRLFDIRLSIEKDENAYKTLLLRSFCRQFPLNKLPEEYYDVIKANSVLERDNLIIKLYEKYKKEALLAKEEAWHCELGSDRFPEKLIDDKIEKQLEGSSEWVLIGGPPCQAYSLVGRSRVGGIDPKDHRVYLYKEYLRIIAKHHPSVFVMENVKGLLSAKVNDEKVFDMIKNDLENPSKVFPNFTSTKYKIYSLSTSVDFFDENSNPIYKDNRDYLIKSEDYGIPQNRHRVILLGIRDDIYIKPEILEKNDNYNTVYDVISSLPKIRSGLSKSYTGYDWITKDGKKKKKRKYQKIDNTNENWINIYTDHLREFSSWSEIDIKKSLIEKTLNTGGEYVKCDISIDRNHSLFKWYIDKKLDGVPNHESRTHLKQDLKRYLFSALYTKKYGIFPKMRDYEKHDSELLPDHDSATSGKFADRFRVQLPYSPATTVTSHISKDGHYFIHYDESQCRSFTVREAARIQTFPDNYVFCGSRTAQYHQVGNAVPPLLAYQIAQIVNNVINQLNIK